MSKKLNSTSGDSVNIVEEENEHETSDFGIHGNYNNTNDIDLLNSDFFPRELLLEEQRLQNNHKTEDEKALVYDLDENERKERFKHLLTLLKNSNNLSQLFESRIKKCKLQIIKKELKKSKKMKENVPIIKKGGSSKLTNNQSTEDMNEEEYYLNLFQQPKLFCGDLKVHQIEGLLWIRTLYENGLNGILADEMGLGKTIQTIAFYCFLLEMGIDGPFIVIAPLSTIPNWLSEFLRFAPKLPTVLYHGTISERIALQSKIKKTTKVNNIDCQPIVITTYDILRFDIKFLKQIDWKFITIDEGQKVKNPNSLIFKCIHQLKCTNKLILTGTPIQNSMTELWALLNWLMPSIFDQLKDFTSWFDIEKFFHSNDKIVNMAKKDELLDIIQKILKPFILRREKKDTDLNLPPKKEIVIYAPMSETQTRLYEATLNKELDVLLNKNPDTDVVVKGAKRKCVESIIKYTDHNAIRAIVPEKEIEVKNMALSVYMQIPFIQLKKIVNHPYLVQMPIIPGQNKIDVNENIIKVSGKFQLLDAMLSKLKILGHKVLLFSTWTQLLDLIEEFLIFRKFTFTRLDGSMTVERRINAIENFKNDKDCFVMMLSTRAGGLGLNLAAADTVIIFDSDWNPQCDIQAQDRCHRMGQTKPVVVYRFCTKNTMDERILHFATAKRKLEKMIIGSGSFSRATVPTLTMSSIEDLLKLLKSSEYAKTIQPNGFIFSDEELDAILDRSDMYDSAPIAHAPRSAKHFKVLVSS